MPDPLKPRKSERQSTYFVQDQRKQYRREKEELARLTLQDRMITTSMGGVLPEQPDPMIFHRVLDVACGTGGWAIEAAQAYPAMSLVGIDISERIVHYAQQRAKTEQVSDRVAFHVMDALRPLSFAPASFDLINLRLGISFVRTWDWPKLIEEFRRLTRPGGIIRLTECEMAESTSPSQTRFAHLLHQAFYHAGNCFRARSDGLTSELAPLLRQHGLINVQTHDHTLIYRAGTPECLLFAQDTHHLFQMLRPFLEKWTRLPEDYEGLSHQALTEMQREDFVATWKFVTAWGSARVSGEAP